MLYSIRHNFRDALKDSALSDDDQDYVMGHAESRMSSRYGSRNLPPSLINRFIGSLRYTDLDLSKIMESPGVPAYREDRIPPLLRERIEKARRRCAILLAEADEEY